MRGVWFTLGHAQMPDKRCNVSAAADDTRSSRTGAVPSFDRLVVISIVELHGSDVALAAGVARGETCSHEITVFRREFDNELVNLIIESGRFQMFEDVGPSLFDLIVT